MPALGGVPVFIFRALVSSPEGSFIAIEEIEIVFIHRRCVSLLDSILEIAGQAEGCRY